MVFLPTSEPRRSTGKLPNKSLTRQLEMEYHHGTHTQYNAWIYSNIKFTFLCPTLTSSIISKTMNHFTSSVHSTVSERAPRKVYKAYTVQTLQKM